MAGAAIFVYVDALVTEGTKRFEHTAPDKQRNDSVSQKYPDVRACWTIAHIDDIITTVSVIPVFTQAGS